MNCGRKITPIAILSSTATTAVNDSQLRITPDLTLSPENEQGMKVLITTSTPAEGASMPVVIFVNNKAVPVVDKYGNIIYGTQLYDGIILKGYFGNNGINNTPHYQLLKLPRRYYYD